MELTEHLFRREWGRLVAALTRVFGIHQLALAEDVAQDTLLRAVEVWKFRGVPENPSAWLMTTAKRRAIDLLRRQRTARAQAPELEWQLQSEWTLAPALDQLLGPDAAGDGQLRLTFSCCHPRLSEDVQTSLILHLLGGFGVREIAAAFLLGEAATEKRLGRGKRVLARSRQLFALESRGEFEERLPAVRRALYLMFNEGYHGACAESAIRVEVCQEAMRLTALLLAHPWGAGAETRALAALQCLHAARLPARVDGDGRFQGLGEQDRSRWDQRLIAEGLRLLHAAAEGQALSTYHFEAALAAVHASAPSVAETNWGAVVSLYDRLLELQPSPVVALHRALAVGQQQGPEAGLAALQTLEGRERLADYPFYAAALGELELACGRRDDARGHFRRAAALARNPTERDHFAARLAAAAGPAAPAGPPHRPA
ncbi:MAG TPA: DUF6596 domain-containing protein [Myxococcales bacterium]|nr:DUF6596 domain-containing protein [Myxococcales bacterium]